MKRMLIRHDGLYKSDSNRFYSLFLERLKGGTLRLVTLRGNKRYGGGGSRAQETTAYEGRDPRKAHAVRERLVNARLKSGYLPDGGTLSFAVRKRLIETGARHDEVFGELVGVRFSPELRSTDLATPPGHLVCATLRGRTLRRTDRRRRYSVSNGRSWLTSETTGLRLISGATDFEHWNVLLSRVGTDLIAPFAPFIIEGSHGAIEPATREHGYTDPEFLPEDIVKIRGEYIGDLPYSERRVILDELLATLDRLGDVSMIIPPEVRAQLTEEARDAARTGRLVPKAQTLPVLRRIDAPIDDERARLLLLPRVERPEKSAA